MFSLNDITPEPGHYLPFDLIQWPLWFALACLAAAYIQRSRFWTALRKKHNKGGVWMRYSYNVLLAGIAGFTAFLILAILCNVDRGLDKYGIPIDRQKAWVSCTFLLLAVLSLPIIMAYWVTWYRLLPGEIHYRTLLGKGVLHWQEVSKIYYASLPRGFYLETKDGKTLRVSTWLTGLPTFAHTALADAPEKALDFTTREYLAQVAKKHR